MKYILVANWKNNPGSLEEANKLLNDLSKKASLYKSAKISTFIAPPLPFLESVLRKGRRFAQLATQDVFPSPSGVYTGETTTDILQGFGVRLAIIGHSERRRLGETDRLVSEKARTSLKAGIIPLVCIGEEAHDSEGNYFETLKAQLTSSLKGIRRDDARRIMIAYEPIWAIGRKSKGAMAPEELAQMIIFIKKLLTEMFSRPVADKIPILYGGSVDPTNAKELVRKTGARGFLVGRASLSAKDFAKVAQSLLK